MRCGANLLDVTPSPTSMAFCALRTYRLGTRAVSSKVPFTSAAMTGSTFAFSTFAHRVEVMSAALVLLAFHGGACCCELSGFMFWRRRLEELTRRT